MNDQSTNEELMSRLLSAPKVFPEERALIAEMADRGVFGCSEFVAECVRAGEPAYVQWRSVERWAGKGGAGARLARTHATRGLHAQGYDECTPPPDADSLQVVLTLDDPKGWVVAAWRDLYAEREQDTEIDMCLEYLTDRRLCWSCGDDGHTESDDLFWCVVCATKETKR